jgi:cytochrome P450
MLNLFSDEARRDPYPLYDQVRAACPVLHEPHSDMWMVFDYESVKRLLSDQDAFSSDIMATASRPTPRWLVFMDPPRHTKLRGIINRAFTPKSVAALEPRIRQLSRQLLDAAVRRAADNGGQIDLAAEYSVPLPMMVIAEMIGIPSDDWPRFTRWSDAILKLSYTIRGLGEDGAMPQGSDAAAAEYRAMEEEVGDYLPQLIARRQGDPAGDLLTRLVEAEVDGDRLSPRDLLSFFQLLLVGGQETTTNLINNALLSLLENPNQLARLRAEPDLMPSTIEESLRYRSPFQFVFRATRQQVSMAGSTIPVGRILLAMIGSANRDPKQFAEPARFDIARHPNPHLAFGHGMHFCLGAPLSRLEASIALSDVLAAGPGLRLASAEPWQPRKALHVHGPTKLPVKFESI